MINNPKIIEEIKENIRKLSKEDLDKAIRETNKFFEENPELKGYKIIFRNEVENERNNNLF